MPLLGAGTQIPNFAGLGGLDPADVDAGFAAVAEILGGVKWAAGVPHPVPGLLGHSNFASGSVGIKNERKREPYSNLIVSTGKARIVTGAPGWADKDCVLGSLLAPADLRLDALFAGFINTVATPQDFDLWVKVDGESVARVTFPAIPVGNTTMVPGAPQLIGGVPVKSGSVVAFYCKGTGANGWIVYYGALASTLHIA